MKKTVAGQELASLLYTNRVLITNALSSLISKNEAILENAGNPDTQSAAPLRGYIKFYHKPQSQIIDLINTDDGEILASKKDIQYNDIADPNFGAKKAVKRGRRRGMVPEKGRD